MSRNRMATALQKTYDDSYLSCSTAVFYEGQGNEEEATRYWKSALDRICDQPITQPFSQAAHRDQSEVEQSLFEAIKKLELQCRERIDLLEALRASRQCDLADASGIQSADDTDAESSISTPGSRFIGQGTIPAVTYSELSRPHLSHRHSPSPRRSADNTRVSFHRPSLDATMRRGSCPGTPSYSNASQQDKPSRTSSPEKHSMKTTLRVGKTSNRHVPIPRTPTANGEGPSKAATLAWNSSGYREASFLSPSQDVPSTPSSASRQFAEQLSRSRKSSTRGDARMKRQMSNDEADAPSAVKTRQAEEWSSSYPSLLSVSAASNALGSSANSLSSTPADKASSSSGRAPASYLFSASSASPRPARDKLANSPSGSNLLGHQKTFNKTNKPIDSGLLDSDILQRRRLRCDDCTKSLSLPSARAAHEHTHPHMRRKSLDYRRNSLGTRRDEERHDEEVPSEAKGREHPSKSSWARQKAQILRSLPSGVDEDAAQQILNEIVVQGDEVRWGDIAGLEVAKTALREAVVYPFLRPDLFMGLREPARGMLLFGPPGTGKTMLARAVATESRSTFFSISASSLTSKYLGESEKLVKALFSLARVLAPSIIFVDEIDSLLSQRSGSGEHEATRRIKTEFLIQWSDLQRAAAGREMTDRDRERGDANRVLVLAATNMPWAIDEAARRRFVRRQYIPLPEATTRRAQLGTLLGQQKHDISADDLERLVELTDGFSGSDITALAKDAAMGPLRSLGEALLHMTMDEIRPIQFTDFEASLLTIRPSVSKSGLEQYEDWAKQFGERGG